MITVTPSLTSVEIFQMLFSRRNSIWNKNQKEVPFYFSASKYALYVVAKALETSLGKAPILFVPDYFCYRSLELVWTKTSCNIIWYPVDKNFSPKWKIISDLAKDSPPNLFMLVHFNGHVDHLEKAEKFCHLNKCLFVEDCAHVLFPLGKIGKYSDLSFFSPHKSLAIPDGSVLYVKRALPLLGAIENVCLGLETKAPCPMKWILKKFLLKFVPSVLQRQRSKQSLAFEIDPPMVDLVMQPKISALGKRILTSFSEAKLLFFLQGRKRSSDELIVILKFLLKDFDYSHFNVNEAPYKLALRFKTSQETIKAFEVLKVAGLWPVSWPDLPPVVKNNEQSIHEDAIALRNTTIYLPVHHQLKFLKEFKCQLKVPTQDIKVEWNNSSPEQWKDYARSIANFNLLQHWGYGEAKKSVSNTPIRRGVIYFQNRPVAIVQAIVKKIGFVTLIRINRGPLFLNSSVTPDLKTVVYKGLRKNMGTGILSFLFIIPELQDCTESHFILSKSRLLRFRGTNSETAWIDLTLNVEKLRENLKSKWRNLLRSAETSGLRFTISNSAEDFAWLEKQHIKDMEQKQFSGVPLELQRQIFNHNTPEHSSMILIAYLEDRPIAGVFIARHLQSATYLVGSNTEEGRRLNANNFLLWNALLEMKSQGCTSFDLGGLGVHVTPHIAHFKRGVGGSEFHYPGEYVTWCR